jgi:hypothetical protein
MKFSEIVKQAVSLLQESERITYRALKREFGLDEEALEDLKSELIKAARVARDENGEVLVWVGDDEHGETRKLRSAEVVSTSQPPSSYTPTHLADRIRAEQAALEARDSTDGERKTITALFADLKGSTALMGSLTGQGGAEVKSPSQGKLRGLTRRASRQAKPEI